MKVKLILESCLDWKKKNTLRIRKGCQPGCQNHGGFEAPGLGCQNHGGSGVSIGRVRMGS